VASDQARLLGRAPLDQALAIHEVAAPGSPGGGGALREREHLPRGERLPLLVVDDVLAAVHVRHGGGIAVARRRELARPVLGVALRAVGPDGLGEVYLGPPALLARAASLPVWGPFPDLRTGRINDGRAFVAIPGSLAFDLEELAARLAPGAAVAFAWHVGSALAEVHERGGAHGALHPAFVGLDARGKLSIRPAFAATLPAETDPTASAQASRDVSSISSSRLATTIQDGPVSARTPESSLQSPEGIRSGFGVRVRLPVGSVFQRRITTPTRALTMEPAKMPIFASSINSISMKARRVLKR
jgi:hypothetical protein